MLPEAMRGNPPSTREGWLPGVLSAPNAPYPAVWDGGTSETAFLVHDGETESQREERIGHAIVACGGRR